MIKLTDKEFELLAGYIKAQSGINLKDSKKTLLEGRLNSLIMSLGLTNFMDYYKYLRQDETGEKLSTLLDKVTTNHTYFMREPEHFFFFRDSVLPYLKANVKNRDLRVWCAASSSGEEPYTLAMIMEEFFKNDEHKWDKRLLATDISIQILEDANKGIYTAKRVSDLPLEWKNRYFTKLSADSYQATPQLKNEVAFRRFNLLEPVFPFKKKFHVIFCRNVMIYFDAPTKDKLVKKLYDCLEPGGYLFIGHSEYINRETSRFKYVKPAVYRKM